MLADMLEKITDRWQRDREADFNARKRERPVTLLLGAVVIAVAVGAALLFAAIAAIARSY